VFVDCNSVCNTDLLESLQETLYYNKLGKHPVSNVITPAQPSIMDMNAQAALTTEINNNKKLSKTLQKERIKSAKLKSEVQILTNTKKRLESEAETLQKDLSSARNASVKLEAAMRTFGNTKKDHLETIARLKQKLDSQNRESADLKKRVLLMDEATQNATRSVNYLLDRIKELEEVNKCKICFEEQVEIVLVPCGHHILCSTCSLKVSKCPMCNAVIQLKVKSFEG